MNDNYDPPAQAGDPKGPTDSFEPVSDPRDERIKHLKRVNQKLRGAIQGLSEETVRHMPRRDLLALQDALADDGTDYSDHVPNVPQEDDMGHWPDTPPGNDARGDAHGGDCPMCGGKGGWSGYSHMHHADMDADCDYCGGSGKAPDALTKNDALEAVDYLLAMRAPSVPTVSAKRYAEIIRRFITEPAVPEAVRRLPDEWHQWAAAVEATRAHPGSTFTPECVRNCADQLDRAIAQTQSQQGVDKDGDQAPTDNGIPELDGLCQQYNDGKIDLCSLVCRAWNSAYSIGLYEQSQQGSEAGRVPDILHEQEVLNRPGAPFNIVNARFYAGGWNACREAMLAAAPDEEDERRGG